MAISRSQINAWMRKAFRLGQSATSFYWDMRAKGISYRKSDMFADWRKVNEIERKVDALKSIRKGYKPSRAHIAEKPWKISKEYMYVFVVKSRATPGDPIEEDKINLMQDRLLTTGEVIDLAWAMIRKQSPKLVEQVVSIEPWRIVHKVL